MYKELFGKRKAIIFDLDGTILNTNKYWELALAKVMAEISIFEIFEGKGVGIYVGDKIQTLLDLNSTVSHGLSLSTLIGYANEEFLKLIDADTSLYVREGFFSLASALRERNMQVVLCTNSDKYVVDRVLAKFRLVPFFDAIFTGDMVKKRKPASDIYKLILSTLKLKAQNCLVFEDSMAGMEAAKAASLDIIAIWDPLSDIRPDEFPDNVVHYTTDFEEFSDNLDTTPRDIVNELKKTYNQDPVSFEQPTL